VRGSKFVDDFISIYPKAEERKEGRVKARKLFTNKIHVFTIFVIF
jgi:hypothetical protein